MSNWTHSSLKLIRKKEGLVLTQLGNILTHVNGDNKYCYVISSHMEYSYRGQHTLCKPQQTRTIESRTTGSFCFVLVYSVSKGVVAFRIWNLCLAAPITHSTCILTFPIYRVASTSTGSSWDFPFVKVGTFKVHLRMPCCTQQWTHNQLAPSLLAEDCLGIHSAQWWTRLKLDLHNPLTQSSLYPVELH